MLKWAENITSGQLFIIYAFVMLIAFGISIRWTTAPFLAFATQFTIGFIGALVNRYFKNRSETAVRIAEAGCNQGRP
jgi:hypothetical protein